MINWSELILNWTGKGITTLDITGWVILWWINKHWPTSLALRTEYWSCALSETQVHVNRWYNQKQTISLHLLHELHAASAKRIPWSEQEMNEIEQGYCIWFRPCSESESSYRTAVANNGTCHYLSKIFIITARSCFQRDADWKYIELKSTSTDYKMHHPVQ